VHTGSCTKRGRWDSFFLGWSGRGVKLIAYLDTSALTVWTWAILSYLVMENGKAKLAYSGSTSVTTQRRNLCHDIQLQAWVASFNQMCLPGFVPTKRLPVLSAYYTGCECCTMTTRTDIFGWIATAAWLSWRRNTEDASALGMKYWRRLFWTVQDVEFPDKFRTHDGKNISNFD
jgi:hypothetical protein